MAFLCKYLKPSHIFAKISRYLGYQDTVHFEALNPTVLTRIIVPGRLIFFRKKSTRDEAYSSRDDYFFRKNFQPGHFCFGKMQDSWSFQKVCFIMPLLTTIRKLNVQSLLVIDNLNITYSSKMVYIDLRLQLLLAKLY